MIRIIEFPKVIEKPCEPVIKHPTEGYAELAPIFLEMVEFLRDRNGLGLAAPQIGDFRRYFVINVGPKPLLAINPSVTLMIEGVGCTKNQEGCYSALGKLYEVKRARKIQLKFEDLLGRKQDAFLTGLPAIVAQHEFGHLQQQCICQPEIGKEIKSR